MFSIPEYNILFVLECHLCEYLPVSPRIPQIRIRLPNTILCPPIGHRVTLGALRDLHWSIFGPRCGTHLEGSSVLQGR